MARRDRLPKCKIFGREGNGSVVFWGKGEEE
jgi:hypothetical protein